MASVRVQALFDHAQQLEERADSRGGHANDYRVADQAWQRAFKAAEREGGAQLLEKMAVEYGFSTPASREAQQSLGHVEPQDVHKPDSDKHDRPQAPVCDFCTSDGARWTYPCEDFTNTTHLLDSSGEVVTTMETELRSDWYACNPCHNKIEANRWPAVLDRHVKVIQARPFPDGTVKPWTPEQVAGERAVIDRVFEGFRECRKPGPPEPVVEREGPGYDGGRLLAAEHGFYTHRILRRYAVMVYVEPHPDRCPNGHSEGGARTSISVHGPYQKRW
jgi:hypothetical protein